ncbi:MAG: hypothetical protein KBD25_05550 [Rickettsiaceae bacterium]|nr:hypothetical protein [Rickettsiaceae bacterium]
MKKVKKLLDKINEEGFKGIKPLYLERESGWHDAYALFFIEFELGEPDTSEEFIDYMEELMPECEINVRGFEVEVIGPNFYMEEDNYYDYILVDELW